MRAQEFVREEITAPWIVPDEPKDPKDMSPAEIEAELEKIDRVQKYITPVDQDVDAGNGDTIRKRISPMDLERINQGLPPDRNIQKLPWTGPRIVSPNTDIET
jgi:hypothetical protein